MGKRVVETFFHADSGRWKNRIVGGPDLPNAYVDRGGRRAGRPRVRGVPGLRVPRVRRRPAPSAATEPGRPSHRQPAAAAPAPPTGWSRPSPPGWTGSRPGGGETGEGEDALRAELAAQVAGQLAAAAHEYAGAAHELAAQIHRAEADQLELVGETERAALQRKAAAVDEELAAAQRATSDQHPTGEVFPGRPLGTGSVPVTSSGPHAVSSREPRRAPRGRRSTASAAERRPERVERDVAVARRPGLEPHDAGVPRVRAAPGPRPGS